LEAVNWFAEGWSCEANQKCDFEGSTMTNRSRILIADDHNLVAELCKRLLEPEFDVVGVVSDGRALVLAVSELRPDVIVVDIAMPILNGLDAGQRAKEMVPSVKVLYVTMTADPEVVVEAFRRGASGYLLKTCGAAEMVVAVRKVLRGESYVSRGLSQDAIDCLRWQNKKLAQKDERLTKRQREVLQLLADGKLMKEVAEILHITPRTVAYHKYRMKDMLGAENNAELIKYAVRNHMVAA
jgi:DNA-binding NarL/FixJ family response regulator